MSLGLLFVDPSEEFLAQAKEYFTPKNYEVFTASNGREAQLSMFRNHLFAVVISLDTKNHSGLQVLKYAKTNHPSLKVVLTVENLATYFENPDEAKLDLLRLGVSDVLQAPLNLDEINKLLEGQQSYSHILLNTIKTNKVSEEVEMDCQDNNFTAVKINEFFPGQTVLFDVYIKIREGRYLKILHTGDNFEASRLSKYKNDNKTQFLYFLKSDRQKYIKFCDYLLESLSNNQKVPIAMKLTLTKNLTEKFVEEIYTEGLKPVIVEQAKEISDSIFNVVNKEKKLYTLLKQYSEFDPSAYTHAYLVTLFSNMIIHRFDWTSKAMTQAISVSCMIHDIGKLKCPPEIMTKRPQEMSATELEEYKKHPEHALEILRNVPFITPAVKQIIYQHHETCDGKGFPNTLQSHKIFTLAKIVCLANDFTHIIQDQKIAPVKAVKVLLSDPESTKRYNSIIIEHLLKVFMDPDLLKKDDNKKIV